MSSERESPAGVDPPGEEPEPAGVDPDDSGEESGAPEEEPDPADDGLGRRGWVLVGALLFGTLVVPLVIYSYPAVLADRVPFLVAMLALPFLPALLLGVLAVWAMAGE